MACLPQRSALLASFAAWIAVAVAAACAGCSRAPAHVNVLIVSIDTLRADHLGCYGYAPGPEPVSPHLDALAREGLLFTQCTTARGQTAPSLGSLMTGLYPSHHGVLDNGFPFVPGVRSLAQELGAAGYDSYAFTSFVPGGRDGKATLGMARDHVFEAKQVHRDWAYARCDEAAEQAFVQFARQRKGAARPFFAWVHFYDVHQPYTPPPPFDALFTGDYRGALRLPATLPTQEAREAWFTQHVEPVLDARMLARAPVEREDARYLVGLYDGGIRATDERVGRMLAALAENGFAEDTLVIVTADHGEELGQHNAFWFHGNSVHEPVLRIPLIVRGPGVRVGRSDALVQNVDLLPTILEWVGAPAAAERDGVSVAALLRAEGAGRSSPRTVAWSEWQDLILGARTSERHLIFNPRGARPRKPPYFRVAGDGGYFVGCSELYDLAADPLELRDRFDEEKEQVLDLRELVAAEYARRGFGGAAARRPAGGAAGGDPAEAKRLKEIGYESPDEVTEAREDVVLEPGACR